MKKLIKQGQSDITSPSMNLTFSEEKEIFRNNLVIVWKGMDFDFIYIVVRC